MNKTNTRFLNKAIVVSVLSIFILVGFFGVVQARGADTSISEMELSVGYAQNEEGLIYGALPQDDTVAAPDLMLVTATNGKDGYAYYSDIIGINPMKNVNDSNINQYILEQESFKTKAFREAAREYCGVDVLSDESAKKCLNELYGKGDDRFQLATEILVEEVVNKDSLSSFKGGSSDSIQSMETLSKSDIEKVMLDENVIIEIKNLASEKTAISVPVYERDGKTVIGEFLVYIM